MSQPRQRRVIRLNAAGKQKLLQAKAAKRNDEGKLWTYFDIAAVAGVSDKTVKRFFAGEPVDHYSAIVIAQALGLEVSEVVAPYEWNSPKQTSEAINWQEVCLAMLQPKRELVSNVFTSGLGKRFEVDDIHVPLGLIERQQKQKRQKDFSPHEGSRVYWEEQEKITPIDYDDFFQKVLALGQSPKSKGKRLNIIGEPGAGKTTQLLKIADWVLAQTQDLPIWVSLGAVGKKNLHSFLIEDWLRDAAQELDAAPPEWVGELEQLLKNGRVWLLLDSADEMGVPDPLGTLAQQLRVPLLDNVRVVLTCRLNLWDTGGNALSDFDTYKMLDFSYGDSEKPDQVKLFIDKWFTPPSPPLVSRGGTLATSPSKGKAGSTSLTPPLARGVGGVLRSTLDEPGKERIKDLIRNPLRLSLLCFTWEFGQGKLPNTKAELYEVFVEALYELKKRVFPTTSAQRRDLNAALGRLALKAIDTGAKSILPHHLVYEELEKPHPELFELMLKLGWLNRVGVDPENPLKSVYAFFHPTFQEYFAACTIDDWHFFLNHILDKPLLGTYRIFEPQWKEVILLWLGREDVAKEQKEAFIRALVEFNDGCNNFYWYRAFFLAATGITEFRDYSRADEIMAQLRYWSFGYLNAENHERQMLLDPIKEKARETLPQSEYSKAISILIEILHTTQDEDICLQAAESLGQIDPDNPIAIGTLYSLLHTTQDEKILQLAARRLGQINSGNPVPITVLTNLLRTPQDEKILQLAAESLGQIDPGNSEASAALVQLNQSTTDEDICKKAVYSLGKIGTDNQTVIATLVELIKNFQSESNRSLTVNRLTTTLEQPQMAIVVTSLKDCLSDEVYENDFERYRDCYQVVWDCAQNLSYPDFYQAWHHPQINPHPKGTQTVDVCLTPSSQHLNLAEFPSLLRAAITNNYELKDNVQLICIDSSKFIDRDNPATKIYNEMRRQGCPKSEDSKPKTMAQLQDYWDELSLDSDKHLVLVFYERTPLALLTKAPVAKGGIREEVGFSNTFLSDLSKFDGAICLVTEQLNIPLKSFSLSQPNLIEDIVEWIRRTALER